MQAKAAVLGFVQRRVFAMSSISRRLIAIDAQNLLGCSPSTASPACWQFAIDKALDAVGFREDVDHVVIAVAPRWAFAVQDLAPGARLVVREGRHGADRALCDALHDTAFIASRYSEVVIASGDHVFCASVRALAEAGVPTTIACLPRQTSRELLAAAAHVMWLDRPKAVLGDAATVAAASVARETSTLAPRHAVRRAARQHARLELAA